MTGGSPASSAYAMPCGTSSAERTSPATMSLGNHFRWYEVINATPGRYARHPEGLMSGWLSSSAMMVSQPSRRALRRHDGRRERGPVDGEAESSVRSLMWGVRHPGCCRRRRAPDPLQRRSRPGRKARHHPHQQPYGARGARGFGLASAYIGKQFPLVIADEAGIRLLAERRPYEALRASPRAFGLTAGRTSRIPWS